MVVRGEPENTPCIPLREGRKGRGSGSAFERSLG